MNKLLQDIIQAAMNGDEMYELWNDSQQEAQLVENIIFGMGFHVGWLGPRCVVIELE